MHTSDSFYIQLSPRCFGHSCDHLQGGGTKDKQLEDETIIGTTKQIQDIKWQ